MTPSRFYGSSVVPSLVGLVVAPISEGWRFGLQNGEEMIIHTQLENTDGSFQLLGSTKSGKEVRTRACSLGDLKMSVLELGQPDSMDWAPFRRVSLPLVGHAPAPVVGSMTIYRNAARPATLTRIAGHAQDTRRGTIAEADRHLAQHPTHAAKIDGHTWHRAHNDPRLIRDGQRTPHRTLAEAIQA